MLATLSAWDFGYSQPVIIAPIIVTAPSDAFTGVSGYYQRPAVREPPAATTTAAASTAQRPEGAPEEGQKAPGGPASSPPGRRAPNMIV